MSYSGTYSYAPTAAQIGIEVFERCGMRQPEVTPDHMLSLKRSMNLIGSSWSNKGVNLWLVEQVTTNLSQGVSEYAVEASTVDVLEAWIRYWQMNQGDDAIPDFSTVLGDATITCVQASNGYVAGGFINIGVPVSVGGLILSGFYPIASVIDDNTFTFEASSNATATVNNGGAVPLFTTFATSFSVTVTLEDHGYLSGQPFVVGAATYVGGITISGTYTIASVTDADNFVITAAYAAGSNDSASENDGQTQIAGNQFSAPGIPFYTDRIMSTFSRTDYSNLPNKTQQGFPTTFWYDRTINPTLTIWLVPDGNGPYQMVYNRVTQPQDVNPQGLEQVYIPYRFQEAYHAAVAAHFAIKWAPDRAAILDQYAMRQWQEAAEEDVEKVTWSIKPQIGVYYR